MVAASRILSISARLASRELDGRLHTGVVEEHLPEDDTCPAGAGRVAEGPVPGHRLAARSLRLLVPAGLPGVPGDLLVQSGELGGLRRDAECLLEISDGLQGRAEGTGPIGRGTQRDPRLCGNRLCLRTGLARGVGVGVVTREDARKLVVAERLEVPRGREVPLPPVAPREGAVGDLSHQLPHETVLPTLRRPWIVVDREQFAPYQRTKGRGEGGLLLGGNSRKGLRGEGFAEHRGILEHAPLRGREGIETRGNERLERFRDVEVRQLGPREVPIGTDLQSAAVDEHPEHLDGIERHAIGTLHDPGHECRRQPGRDPVDELGHDRRREWLQVQRQDVAMAGAPGRSPFEQLGPRKRDDEQPVAA